MKSRGETQNHQFQSVLLHPWAESEDSRDQNDFICHAVPRAPGIGGSRTTSVPLLESLLVAQGKAVPGHPYLPLFLTSVGMFAG